MESISTADKLNKSMVHLDQLSRCKGKVNSQMLVMNASEVMFDRRSYCERDIATIATTF